MSDKIAVVYIGDKPSKKDTRSPAAAWSSRAIPQWMESHIAMQPLEFERLIRHEALAGELARQETTCPGCRQREGALPPPSRPAWRKSRAWWSVSVICQDDLCPTGHPGGREDLDIEPQGP